MPGIYEIRISDANVRVGPNLELLEGYGDSDKFTLAPFTDVGSFMSGIDGDTLHVIRQSNGWLFTITVLQGSKAVTTLGAMFALSSAFQLQVSYGAFNFQGFANLINLGEVAASLSTTTRTFTMGASKVTGNTGVAPGQLLQVL
jgi:hypothetical protein